MYARLILLSVAAIGGLQTAKACACETAGSACREVAAGRMVFIGTVESISPRFLDHWNLARRPSLTDIIDSDERYLANGSPQNLEALKNEIRKKLSDLPAIFMERLTAASTQDAVARVFDEVLNRGRTVNFRVNTLFSRGGEDDTDADTDDDSAKSIEVSTPFGDCGYNFQQGETYLVYAVIDEDTNEAVTDTCTPTKRLSDAGADLPYLYFLKQNKQAAGQLEGVATYDARPVVDFPDGAEVPALPAAGLVIGAWSGDAQRYTVSDARGRFVFDGLAAGDYAVRVWAAGYPDTVSLLAGPSEIRIGPKSCVDKTLFVPPR